jgi:8-oxo-dGTP pyrophosphatase MutT (NUDIX family)
LNHVAHVTIIRAMARAMLHRLTFSREIDRLRSRLNRAEPAAVHAGKVAAVLVPIFERGAEPHVLFIRRSELVSHQGQVAFPGGRLEPTDRDLAETALREAHEEVGIRPEEVDLLGRLGAKSTRVSGYLVAPFVGVIPDPKHFRHDPREVAEVFTVPLDALADPSYRGTYEFRPDGRPTSSHPAILYKGQTIWGLTYRITLDLLALLDIAAA